MTVAELNVACERSSDGGHGFVALRGRVVIRDEVGEIESPCELRLHPGASLVLSNVDLITRDLTITDTEPNGPSRLEVLKSKIGGVAGSEFIVNFNDKQDKIVVQATEIDFSERVWIIVHGNAQGQEGGGYLRMAQVLVRSIGENTEGIVLAASEVGGVADFQELILESPANVPPFIFAGECNARAITGAPEHCGPSVFAD